MKESSMADSNGNGRNVRMVPIQLGDILMLMEAMRLAGNTAMMSSLPLAEKRLREYQAMFDDMVPAGARIFDGEVWAEINITLATATSYRVFVQKKDERYYWGSDYSGYLIVQVGERSWRSLKWDVRNDGEEMKAVIQTLEELAPLDCVRTPSEEVPQGS
jgi:hypothetical protein